MTSTQKPQFGAATGSSNMCGVTLMDNQIGYIVADICGAGTGYRRGVPVDGPRRRRSAPVFDFDESRIVGSDFDQTDFEETMSTQYRHGPLRRPDDALGNPEDAAEYIDFDLRLVD